MSQAVVPRISRRPRFPVVWLVPLVALGIGGWMLFHELRSRGPEITIHFPSSAGVEAGKTALIYKGVSVGTVREIALEKDLNGVVVRLQLDKEAAAFARTGAQFWIVRPEVTFSGVRGLETLIAGVQLNGLPGQGTPTAEFKGLEHEAPPEETRLGRAFVLRADKLGSLNSGAPVYYREVKVGAVETSRLANDAAEVLIRIRVYSPYVDLVRPHSQFWNAGGVDFKVSLLGAELKSTSLESAFTGGIAFATPEKDEQAPVAEEGAQFQLHDGPEKEWLKWQPQIPIKPVDSERVRSPSTAEVTSALKR